MNLIFADTFYYFALLNPASAKYSRAFEITSDFSGRIVTTAYTEALTGDHHFEQAGFIALLK